MNMADPGEMLVGIFQYCMQVMKMEFLLFGLKISYWDVLIWSIIMYALLKLFFRLFE